MATGGSVKQEIKKVRPIKGALSLSCFWIRPDYLFMYMGEPACVAFFHLATYILTLSVQCDPSSCGISVHMLSTSSDVRDCGK